MIFVAVVVSMLLCDHSVTAFGSRSSPSSASSSGGSNNFRPPTSRRTLPRSKRDKVSHHRTQPHPDAVMTTTAAASSSSSSSLDRTTRTSDTSLSSTKSASQAADSSGDDIAAGRDGTNRQDGSNNDDIVSLEAQLEISTQDIQQHQQQDQQVSSSKKLLLGSLIGFTALASACAYSGILPGYVGTGIDGGVVVSDATTTTTGMMIVRDVGATWICAALAYALVKINTYCFENEIYGPNIARKVVHLLSGPAFIFALPMFTVAAGAKYFASIVALTNLIQLYLSGKNMGDPTLAKSVSRSGESSEALGGPFIYVLIVQACVFFFWRTSPVGVVALSTMAAGDGMADLVGRKWGRSNKCFFSDSKSMVGTLAFATFSAMTSFGLIQWLMFTDCLTLPSSLSTMDILIRIIGISVTSAVIELIPVGDDNITVPLTAGILAALLLQ